MFSFHRPKVYRSSTGCCICKAKSSSSRFTDSKKYEEDFLECFKLSTPRQGEICNACVLLVKRWKKLPAGSDRNWQHVVDARAGPGMKSMTKFKSKNKKSSENGEKIKKKKQYEREYSPVSDKSDGNEDVELVEEQEVDSLSEVDGSSRTGSPGGSDCEENGGIVEKSRRHKSQVTKRRENVQQLSGFIDLDYWKEETICCGIIFKGMNNEIIMDPSFFKPCNDRLSKCKRKQATIETSIESDGTVVVTKLYSDSSSDSGYDESSNQGTLPDNNTYNNNNVIKKEQVSIEELNRQIPKITTN